MRWKRLSQWCAQSGPYYLAKYGNEQSVFMLWHDDGSRFGVRLTGPSTQAEAIEAAKRHASMLGLPAD